MTTRGFVVALLGAESTGKTTLALDLREAFAATGRVPAEQIGVVPEYLRGFCEQQRRTPHLDEQWAIAAEQTAQIDAAASRHALVIADTTALMTAVYSEIVFGDRSLYPSAEAAHARVDLTLLTALDLPWQADGLQRDGPHVREPVDALIRAALDRCGRPYAIVHGTGRARVDAAFACWAHAWSSRTTSPPHEPSGRWRAHCERCGDPACERLLSALPPTPATADPPA